MEKLGIKGVTWRLVPWITCPILVSTIIGSSHMLWQQGSRHLWIFCTYTYHSLRNYLLQNHYPLFEWHVQTPMPFKHNHFIHKGFQILGSHYEHIHFPILASPSWFFCLMIILSKLPWIMFTLTCPILIIVFSSFVAYYYTLNIRWPKQIPS